MSTLNVNNIDKESGSTLTIGGSGTTVNVSNMVPDVALSNRNLIINGAMQVAQRATQVTGVTGVGYRTCDRFLVAPGSLGTWTVDQSTDAPSGFSNSLKVTCTTADASPAAGDYFLLTTALEAQNLQHLAYGTSNAKSLTLSFWIKSNKTGSASFDIRQIDNSNKLFSNSYLINSANTWEYKTISIPADTAGVINNDNGAGFVGSWWLNSGSDYSGGTHATTWSTLNPTNRNVSNLGVGGAVSDYFAITGVQLEVGDVATPFEHESYGETLQKCQRYYHTSGNVGVAGVTSGLFTFVASSVSDASNTNLFPVDMRAAPTITFSDNAGTLNSVHRASIGDTGTTVTVNGYSKRAWTSIYKASGWATGNVLMANYSADAEL